MLDFISFLILIGLIYYFFIYKKRNNKNNKPEAKAIEFMPEQDETKFTPGLEEIKYTPKTINVDDIDLKCKLIETLPKYPINITQHMIPRRSRKELENIKYSNITPKGKFKNFVVVDTETTGLNSAYNEIIELSAVKFINNQPTEIFTTLIKPNKPIPIEATRINNITNEMVEKSPSINQIIESFDEFICGFDIVAHNLDFDIKFIHKAGSKMIDSKRRYFCTLKQSKKILNKDNIYSYKLSSLCDYFGINFKNQHRAYADAYCTGLLFNLLIKFKQY